MTLTVIHLDPDTAERVASGTQTVLTFPPCATCGGRGVVITPDTVGRAFAAVLDRGRGAGVPHLTCPDCPLALVAGQRIGIARADAFGTAPNSPVDAMRGEP
jgi:hypothetical protein